jgi:hypothetical protein
MKTNGYRDLIGIKFLNDADFEEGTKIIFGAGYAFELIRGNIFLVSVSDAKILEDILQKKGVKTKRVSVISINDLPPEERARIRKENLQGSIPIPL